MQQALRELIDRLVDQFSDPYAFLRELVQNSLDAGSQQVEFEFHYDQKTSVLTCQDTGEGMDEQLIDTRLTRIFASSKEADFTKIGQFGIGFLSVFALKPDHVVVDTGRNGQAWRIHFSSDHRFRKTPLREPVDGTHIRWIKRQKLKEHEKFKEACLGALKHWCKHAQADIQVDGVTINTPFPWEHPLAVHHRQPGTEVVIVPCQPDQGWLGLYNQGLTLSEGSETPWPGLSVKINSRYLEHTLTRDRVVRNENFSKAQQIVDQVLVEQLLPRLLQSAAEDLAGPPQAALAPHLAKLRPAQRRMPILPGFERGYTLDEMSQEAKRERVFLYSSEFDAVAQRLSQSRPVLAWPGPKRCPGPEQLLARIQPQARLVEVQKEFFLPEIIQPDPQQRVWLKRLLNALTSLGEFYQAAWLTPFPDHWSDRAWLACLQPSEPVSRNFQPVAGKSRQLLLHLHHPIWRDLWGLEEDWGEAALQQPLWTAFPQLFGDQNARQRQICS